jgi:integrase
MTLCAEYLRQRSYELQVSTQELTLRACRWLDGWWTGCRSFEIGSAGDLSDLTGADALSWRAWLVETGRLRTTANIYVRAVRPVFRWAVRSGRLPADPFESVREFRVTPGPVTVYEDWQFERMLYNLPHPTCRDPKRDLRWLGILWGARTTGLRRGELLNLTADNVRGGMVFVEPKKATATTWAWEPKDRRVRKLPLAPQFADVLAALGDRHYSLLCPADCEAILREQKAGRLSDRRRKCPEPNFRRTLVGIQRRAFGRQIGDFHQFRRTFTTHMADVLPDKALMELTGHSQRRTLDRYTAVRQSHFQAAFEAVSGILRKGAAGLQIGDFRGPPVDGSAGELVLTGR